MIKSVIFVEAVQLFGEPHASTSFTASLALDSKATLRDGCVVLTRGELESIVPFANIKVINRTATTEAAKK